MDKGSSYIRRKKKESNFTRLPNEMLRNNKISWKARGLLAYMLSMPDDWVFYDTELIKHSEKDGVSSLKSAMKELKQGGYVVKEPLKDEKGKIVKWLTYIQDEPIQMVKNPQCGQTTIKETHKVENDTLLTTDLTNDLPSTNDLSLKPIVPAKAETAVQANKMPDEMIEMILNYFNQKLNKTRGFSKTDSTTKLLNALYKAGYKDIGLYQYVIDNKYNDWINNEKYKKYLQPATLFAKENFEKYMEQDEISLTPATNNNNQQPQTFRFGGIANEQTRTWNDTGLNGHIVPKQIEGW